MVSDFQLRVLLVVPVVFMFYQQVSDHSIVKIYHFRFSSVEDQILKLCSLLVKKRFHCVEIELAKDESSEPITKKRKRLMEVGDLSSFMLCLMEFVYGKNLLL